MLLEELKKTSASIWISFKSYNGEKCDFYFCFCI